MAHALLVDGTNLLVRSLFASQHHPLGVTWQGQVYETGPMLLWVRMIAAYVKRVQPTHLLVGWDPPSGGSWRKEVDPSYKANRSSSRDGIERPEELVHRFCAMANIPGLQIGRWEADDIVAAGWQGFDSEVTVLSSDADLLQLVDDRTTVIRPGVSPERWGPDEVRAKYGIESRYLGLYKALVGDTSDGLPGTPGIGKKRAAALLGAATGPVEEVAAALELDDRRREAFEHTRTLVELPAPDGQNHNRLHPIRVPLWIPTAVGDSLYGPLLDFLDSLRMQSISVPLGKAILWDEGESAARD